MDRRCFLRLLTAIPGLGLLARIPGASPKEGSELVDGDEGLELPELGVMHDLPGGSLYYERETSFETVPSWMTRFRFGPSDLHWTEKELLSGPIPGPRGDLESMGMGFSGSRDM